MKRIGWALGAAAALFAVAVFGSVGTAWGSDDVAAQTPPEFGFDAETMAAHMGDPDHLASMDPAMLATHYAMMGDLSIDEMTSLMDSMGTGMTGSMSGMPGSGQMQGGMGMMGSLGGMMPAGQMPGYMGVTPQG